MSFEFFLENVSDPTGHMSAVDFYEISDLSPEELELFASAWYPLPIERQREIASTMVEAMARCRSIGSGYQAAAKSPSSSGERSEIS